MENNPRKRRHIRRSDSSWFPGGAFVDGKTQGHANHSGVVLKRDISPEGDAILYLFLKGLGPITVYAPGASRGRIRFGGAIEPLTWANFNLYRGTKYYYLTSAEIKEDFWQLRNDPSKIAKLMEWDVMLCRHLAPRIPCDDVLALFYWSGMHLKSDAHPLVAEWRFYWKWLRCWGLAPSPENCAGCGAPISEARLTLLGFLCPSCARDGEGARLSAREMDLLRMSLSAPARAFAGLFPATGLRGQSHWAEVNSRLKRYFDAMA